MCDEERKKNKTKPNQKQITQSQSTPLGHNEYVLMPHFQMYAYKKGYLGIHKTL